MPIYFVRHGESTANVKKVFTGRDNPSLTEKGRKQAEEEAKILSGYDIDTIISSPLNRAAETASIIASGLGIDKDNIVHDNRIAEFNLGTLAGTPKRKVPSDEMLRIEGIEPPAIFRARILDFLNELKNDERKILVVSHNGVYKMIESTRLAYLPEEFHAIDDAPNSKVIELDLVWLDK